MRMHLPFVICGLVLFTQADALAEDAAGGAKVTETGENSAQKDGDGAVKSLGTVISVFQSRQFGFRMSPPSLEIPENQMRSFVTFGSNPSEPSIVVGARAWSKGPDEFLAFTKTQLAKDGWEMLHSSQEGPPTKRDMRLEYRGKARDTKMHGHFRATVTDRMVYVAKGTCTEDSWEQNKPAMLKSIDSLSLVASPKTIEETGAGQEALSTGGYYWSKELHCEIRPPSLPIAGAQLASIVAFGSNPSEPHVAVAVSVCTRDIDSVKTVIQANLVKDGNTVLDSGQGRAGKGDSVLWEYRGKAKDVDVHGFVRAVLGNGMVYVIRGLSLESKWQENKDLLRESVNSFQLTLPMKMDHGVSAQAGRSGESPSGGSGGIKKEGDGAPARPLEKSVVWRGLKCLLVSAQPTTNGGFTGEVKWTKPEYKSSFVVRLALQCDGSPVKAKMRTADFVLVTSSGARSPARQFLAGTGGSSMKYGGQGILVKADDPQCTPAFGKVTFADESRTRLLSTESFVWDSSRGVEYARIHDPSADVVRGAFTQQAWIVAMICREFDLSLSSSREAGFISIGFAPPSDAPARVLLGDVAIPLDVAAKQ